ncbi:MAG: arsenate reductase ArsC [Candidatus Krumholzibacteriia bacterium]
MKVLFMCTANSCRSQMAEAWARSRFPAQWHVASCGLVTSPIAEETRAVMAEAGCDLTGQRSKSLDELDLEAYDLVVTLSDTAARFLPRLGRPERHVHRPVPDPTGARGSREDVLDAYRAGRDAILRLVEDVAAGRLVGDHAEDGAGP